MLAFFLFLALRLFHSFCLPYVTGSSTHKAHMASSFSSIVIILENFLLAMFLSKHCFAEIVTHIKLFYDFGVLIFFTAKSFFSHTRTSGSTRFLHIHVKHRMFSLCKHFTCLDIVRKDDVP